MTLPLIALAMLSPPLALCAGLGLLTVAIFTSKESRS